MNWIRPKSSQPHSQDRFDSSCLQAISHFCKRKLMDTDRSLSRHLLMARDCLSLEEVQSGLYRTIVHVSFFDVCMTSSQMCSYETKSCVVILQTNARSTFISGHSSEASLSSTDIVTLIGIFDLVRTFRVVASTLRMTAVSSDFTKTIRAVPTNYEDRQR